MSEFGIATHLGSPRGASLPIKLAAAIAVEAGASKRRVAEYLHVSRRSLGRWVAQVRAGGLAELAVQRGRPRSITPDVAQALAKDLARNPWEFGYNERFWFRGLVQAHLLASYGLAVSRETAGRVMRGLGYTFQRSVRNLTPSELKARRAAAAIVSAAARPASGESWFEDEAYFELAGAGGGRWLSPDRAGATVNFSGPRRGCLMFGALRHDGLFLMERRDAATAAATIDFLRLVLLHAGPDRPLRLVWDNASCHRARAPRQWAEGPDAFLPVFLPTYCSELNPIEGVWDLLRRDCLGQVTDAAELETALLNRAAAWASPNAELLSVVRAYGARKAGAGRRPRGERLERSAERVFGGNGDGKGAAHA